MRTNNGNRSYSSYDNHGDRGYGNRGYNARGNDSYRNEGGELSVSAYNGVIGAVLAYGLLVNVVMVTQFSQTFVNMNPIVLLIVYFIMALAGVIISRKSDNPWISFIGYNLVVLPLGMVLSVCLNGVATDLIIHALGITATVVVTMIVLSVIMPRVFLSMGRVLGIVLLIVIIAEVICLIVKGTLPAFWDILVALLFSLYVGYDWARAQDEYHSYDNAIDACVSLYLDIVNLFLRILSIMGRRDD